MDSERLKPLKENFRRSLHSLADAVADIADELLNATSKVEQTREPNKAPQEQKQILDKKEVAKLLGISTRSINDRMNEGLPFFNTGRNVRFNREKVLIWAENRKIKRRRKNHLRVIK